MTRAARGLAALAVAGLLGRGAWSAVTEPQVFVAFLGDSGSGDTAQKAVARQLDRLRDRLRFAFLLGDNVYYEGRPSRFDEAFLRVYSTLLRDPRGIEFHAALGNHDVKGCRVLTEDELPAPGLDGLPDDHRAYAWDERDCHVESHLREKAFGYVGGKRYYRVSVTAGAGGDGLADVFVLDSNTLSVKDRAFPTRSDGTQTAWLRRELARSSAPWRIVILHHPMQTPVAKGYLGIGGHGPERKLEEELLPILREGRVDAVFAGHNHFYARLRPQYGIRHFVSGGGGIPVYGFKRGSAPVESGGGFHHFVSVRLTPSRFEFCTVDRVGSVRDAGFWDKQGASGDLRHVPSRSLPACSPWNGRPSQPPGLSSRTPTATATNTTH